MERVRQAVNMNKHARHVEALPGSRKADAVPCFNSLWKPVASHFDVDRVTTGDQAAARNCKAAAAVAEADALQIRSLFLRCASLCS